MKEILQIAKTKVEELNILHAEQKDLSDKQEVLKKQIQLLEPEVLTLIDALKILNPNDFKKWHDKQQFNIKILYVELPTELNRILNPVVEKITLANTANTGTTNMENIKTEVITAKKVETKKGK